MTARAFVLSALAAASFAASAAPVSLSGWGTMHTAALSGQPGASWSSSNGVVKQSTNGQPSLYLSAAAPLSPLRISGQVRTTDADDDFFGWALGVGGGDWLLIDWKKADQTHNFAGGAATATPGSTAYRGLAASRVTGTPTADEFWGHTNFSAHSAGGLSELARGSTLGSSAYTRNAWYDFELLLRPEHVDFSLNGVHQFRIEGDFLDGRWGFYNFSQPGVEYRRLDATAVPLPASLGLSLGALGVMGLAALRRRRAA